MTRSLLTITIPTWNRSAYLQEALESISSQAVALGIADRIDILIADNASEDETPEVIQTFIEAGSVPVRWHRQERNLGPVTNILYCLTHAQGEFLMLLGDDDIMAPGGLEAVWKTLHGYPGATVFIFKNTPDTGTLTISETAQMTTAEAARRAYYHMGNAGVFAVRSDLARQAVGQCGAGHPWTCWLQTETMLRAAALSGQDRPFVLSPLTSSGSPHHGPNTRSTAYYVWESSMAGLLKTALNARAAIGEEAFTAALGHLSTFKYVAFKLWVLSMLLTTSATMDERRAFQTLTAQTRLMKVPAKTACWLWIADRLGRVPPGLLKAFVRTVRFIRHHTKPGHSYQNHSYESAAGSKARSYTAGDFEEGGRN